MKRIFIFPTIEEAKAFILTEPRDPVFVGGVGMAEIAAATVKAVKARKPQLVVLAGIAGTYDRTLRRGEVVEVVTERVAGIPGRYAREYETSGPDLGLPFAAGVTVSRSGEGLAANEGKESRAEGSGNAVNSAATFGYPAESAAAHTAKGPQHELSENACFQPESTAKPLGHEMPGDTERMAADTQPGTPDKAGDQPPGAEENTQNTPGECLPEVENMEGAAFFAVCEALGVTCCEIRAVSNHVGEPFGQWAVEEAVGNLTEKLNQIFGNDE